MNVFSSRLKYVRQSKNLTQKQLALMIDVSPAMMCKYETSEAYPSYETLIKISQVLEISLDYLCGIEYSLNDNNSEYIVDEKLLKTLKRSKILYSFIQDDPRNNILLLEKFIKNLN